VPEFFALFFGVRWVPRDVCGRAFEEIRHEDLVLIGIVRSSEDIGALERLWEVSKNIEDVEDSFRGIGWAGNVGLEAANCFIFAFC